MINYNVIFLNTQELMIQARINPSMLGEYSRISGEEILQTMGYTLFYNIQRQRVPSLCSLIRTKFGTK